MAYQVSTGRFVGRTQELARLSQLLAHAADGTPLVAVIGGEAGVGKTWLAERLAAIASEQSVRVLRGGYVPLDEDGLPFVPVTEHCAAWSTSWTRRSWMRSRVRPGWSGQAAAGCCGGGCRAGVAVRAAARGSPAAGRHRAAAVDRGGPALGRPLHRDLLASAANRLSR
jgi:predicted ATPase